MDKDFLQVFNETLDKIKTDAQEVGLNLTSICREIEISRDTPERWFKRPPMTIKIVADMQKQIVERRAAIAADDIVRAKHVPAE